VTVSPETCAEAVLDTVPLIMRTIRAEMRAHRDPELSVPHFRALAFLDHNPGASLSAAAEHIGLRLPSMSALIDGLVTRGLVSRAPSPADRRRLVLALTPHGRACLNVARRETQARLAERLAALPASEREAVVRALGALRSLFAPRD
jgi:DNA-binding MarR family transcriptional regulator